VFGWRLRLFSYFVTKPGTSELPEQVIDLNNDYPKVDIVIFSLVGCGVCASLKQMIAQVMKSSNIIEHRNRLRFHEVYPEIYPEFAPASRVRPRMFPTVIAYRDDVPLLGWEGFAVMEPGEIQESIILEVLEQAAALLE
jgi:hypothetical protein